MQSELTDKITSVLIEYDYRESDIPLTHEYWSLKNQLRAYVIEQNNKLDVPVFKVADFKQEELELVTTAEPVPFVNPFDDEKK